jgi:mRNA interferase YafQ
MRTIERTSRFKRDYKREKKGRSASRLDDLLGEVIEMLRKDAPLPPRFRDHPLSGAWDDCRDCHVRPDLVLIYRKPDDETLQLVRLGSHSQLGL